MEFRSQVLRALRWSILSKGMAQLISWSITIFIVRILTPDDFGLMAIAMMFVNLVFMLNEIGLGAALVQMKELEEEVVRKIYSFIIFINVGLFILLFLAAPLIADFFSESRVTLLIRVLSVQFLFSAFELVPMALLERDLELKKKALAQLSGDSGRRHDSLLRIVRIWRLGASDW